MTEHRTGEPPQADASPYAGSPERSDGAPGDSRAAEAPTRQQLPATRRGDVQPGWRARRRARKAAKTHRKAPWWELPALVVLAVGIAILVKSFVIQPFYIPSESMEKTLHGCGGCHGDRILVNKLIYDFRDPHPGDIVVFHAPPGWNDEPASKPPSNPALRVVRGFGQLIGFVPPDGQILVKRVIAVGGQTVKGNSAGDVFISNTGPDGPYRKLVEPFVFVDAMNGQQPAFGPVTVPKGRLWVMGDHRNDSADSRYHCLPNSESPDGDKHCNPMSSTVPVGDVIGKAFVIAWPPSRWRTLGTPATFENHGARALGAIGAGSVVPAGAGAVVALPLYAVRRRRRTRRGRRRGPAGRG